MPQPFPRNPSPLPFRLLGAAALLEVHALLEQALRDWCADWGVARDGLVLETLRAWEAAGQLPAAPAWRRPWRAADGAMTLAWPAEMPAQLQRLLFAPERHCAPAAGAAVSAPAVAEAAWAALAPALAAQALPGGWQDADSAGPAPTCWRRGSGAVLLALRLGKHSCYAVLDDDAVQALLRQARLRGAVAPAPALPPLPALDYGALLAPLEVALPVELGRAEVSLGSLMRLEAGDVIRLDTLADRAIRVGNPAGAALFDGYLGLAGGRLALELVRHDLPLGDK